MVREVRKEPGFSGLLVLDIEADMIGCGGVFVWVGAGWLRELMNLGFRGCDAGGGDSCSDCGLLPSVR